MSVEMYAEDFNKLLNKLMKKLTSHTKNADVLRLKDRLRIVINATPFLLIEQASDVFWQCRHIIKSMYLANNKYDWARIDEINTIIDKYSKTDNEDNSPIVKLVEMIKHIFLSAQEEEKIEVYKDTCEGLSIIANYKKFMKNKANP